MKYEIRTDLAWGRVIWFTDGKTDLAATLDVGIRIIHLSVHGMENLYYQQPQDLSDGVFTKKGWKLIGGHRFWLAPESEKSYWPDVYPVEFEVRENAVILAQPFDPWLDMQKTMRLEFQPDGTIRVEHCVINLGDETQEVALWGIHTLCGGTGVLNISDIADNEYNPTRTISLWGKTSLGDPRIRFTADKLFVKHEPMDAFFKIGVFCRNGHIHHENLGQSLDISFPVALQEAHADGGCNAEIYLDRHFMELESLGPLISIKRHARVSWSEIWQVRKL